MYTHQYIYTNLCIYIICLVLVLLKHQQVEFSNTELYTVVKRGLLQGCKAGSVSKNQSMSSSILKDEEENWHGPVCQCEETWQKPTPVYDF